MTQLTWTHYLVLLSLKDYNAISYYIKQVTNRNLSKRQLEEIIKSNEYERLPIETKNKLVAEDEIDVKDLVPNPILIKNIKTIEENDTVGIIICKQDNEYVIKYCSDDRIIAREYKLV